MDVFAGIVHGHARERHPMLPTDQSTHAPGGSRYCRYPAAITVSPHEAFGVGRDELSVVVSELSILGNSEKRIVECPISGTGIHSLINSDHNRNFEILRRSAQRPHFFTGNDD